MISSTNWGLNWPSNFMDRVICFPILSRRLMDGLDGPPRSLLSEALGVGKRPLRIAAPITQFHSIVDGHGRMLFWSCFTGVGHNPDTLAAMGSAQG
jgi:hypothetical protein